MMPQATSAQSNMYQLPPGLTSNLPQVNGTPDMNQLIQLETLKFLHNMRKKNEDDLEKHEEIVKSLATKHGGRMDRPEDHQKDRGDHSWIQGGYEILHILAGDERDRGSDSSAAW